MVVLVMQGLDRMLVRFAKDCHHQEAIEIGMEDLQEDLANLEARQGIPMASEQDSRPEMQEQDHQVSALVMQEPNQPQLGLSVLHLKGS